ncbi:MAG: transposase, partial [Dongiaceae bacterium]
PGSRPAQACSPRCDGTPYGGVDCPADDRSIPVGSSANVRFLIHVLPSGFHRIRHYGLFANGGRAENLARARELLGVQAQQDEPGDADASGDQPPMHSLPCPCCGGRMIIIEIFERGSTPSTRPSGPIRIDTS